jgi:hypothetical protein
MRKRSIYVDPDTDEDEFELSDDDFQPEPRPAPEPVRAPAATRQKTKARPSRPQTRSKSSVKSAKERARRPKPIGAPRRRNHTVDAEEAARKKTFQGPSDGQVPAWTSLPLEILRQIFIHASQPLQEQTRDASANAAWLIKASRTCRTFAQPALEAYYHAPPIHNPAHPHHLLALLQIPKDKRYMDYNVKVKRLDIDVRRLAYTAHNRPLFDLSLLVAELPQLQHLEISRPVDQPPFRHGKLQSWYYPADFFQTLEDRGNKLRTWRWNRDMLRDKDPTELYNHMTLTHSSKAFEYLTELSVCGFNYNDSAEPMPPEDGTEVSLPGLATSISLLPSLKDLTFISCDVIMNKFLERLPRNLERLELINCLELTSDMIQGFLASGGSQLRELVLNHNTALNLAFLPTLKVNCPKLEVLKMDLRYYSERVNSNDAEPLYDELLTDHEIPTWPATLRHLELVHLQRWSAEAAQNLFRSLLDAAADLPDLRCLVLHSHINIAWRDRAGFRDQWIERLQRVYLRGSEPPNPFLGSLRQYRLWKQAQASGRALPPNPNEIAGGFDTEDEVATGKKLSHIQVSPAKSRRGETEVFSESSPEKQPPTRRSKRVAENRASLSAASPSAEDSANSDDGSDADDWRKQPEKHIQGLCELVDIRIDNQRPRENQFTEGDFLDSEASGDEDWREDADEGEEDGYA